jgi:hypothetical protein
MTKNLIYFLLGVLITVFSCVYYYSGIIQTYKWTVSELNNTKFNQYKYQFSDTANKIIKVNNSSIQTLMERQLTDESTKTAHMLLASSLFLSKITYQEQKLLEEVFLTTALFYKKTESEADFIKFLPILVEECDAHNILPDCSIEHVQKLTDLIK